MERSILFYFLLGAGVVLVPALTDRLLKGRVTDWVRVVRSWPTVPVSAQVELSW